MAISFDNATSARSSQNVASLTFSHTTGTGLLNSVILIGIGYYAGLSVSVSGITCAGNNLTKIRRDNDGSHAAATELWIGLAPTSGANNVVVTFTGSVGAGDDIRTSAKRIPTS
jgi:hypothetical protein